MVLAEESEIMAGKETAPPLAKIMQKAIESAAFMTSHETCGRALQAAYDGLDLASETGVHMCDPILSAHGSYACLSLQDPEKGIDFLRKLEGSVEHLGRFHRSYFAYLTG